MCYHIGISSFGGLVYSFSQLYFTINLEEIFYFNNKKCRIYTAFGVSQTPKINMYRKGEIKENIMIVDGNRCYLKKSI